MRIDQRIDPGTARASTVLSAVIYLMTVYQRQPSPQLALAISQHLECLANHTDVDEVVRHVADGMRDEWEITASTTERLQAEVRPTLIN